MKTLLINELSKKTGVSIQTLRYYDAIGLLKPSYRRDTGYRLYTYDDLVILQKITALKFFKFPLKTIKALLNNQESFHDQLKKQSLSLQKQAEELHQAHTIIEQTLANKPEKTEFSGDSIITLIRMYSMNTLQETKKIFTETQIEQLIDSAKSITEEDGEEYGKLWKALIEEVVKHLDESPRSEVGKRYAIAWMALKNKHFQDQKLNDTIWNAYMNDQFKDVDNEGYYKLPLSVENPELHLRFPKIPKKVIAWINEAVKYLENKK